MKRIIKSTLLAFAAMTICSCNTPEVTPLTGEWIIEEVNGKSAVGETTPFIGFNLQDSTIYGSNSCNRFFGTIVYDDTDASAISFSNMGATRMMCANSPMEEEIQAAINVVASFSYTDNGAVELLADDDSVLLLISPKVEE